MACSTLMAPIFEPPVETPIGGSLAVPGAAGRAAEEAPLVCAKAIAETITAAAVSERINVSFMRLPGLLKNYVDFFPNRSCSDSLALTMNKPDFPRKSVFRADTVCG